MELNLQVRLTTSLFYLKKDLYVLVCQELTHPKITRFAERFIRAFKEHKINNKTLQQELFHQIEINSKFRGYRKIFNFYVKDLDLKPNTKSKIMSPERLDTDAQIASMLMTEPKLL